jgi:hypothetical protein
MEPECSLRYSKMPATRSYSEPAQSSPYPHIPLPEDPFIKTYCLYKTIIYLHLIFKSPILWTFVRKHNVLLRDEGKPLTSVEEVKNFRIIKLIRVHVRVCVY